MNVVIFFTIFISCVNCDTMKHPHQNRGRQKTTTTTTSIPKIDSIENSSSIKITKPVKIKIPQLPPDLSEKKFDIPLDVVQKWAQEISDKLYLLEKQVVRREFLLKSFSDIKIETRNGSAIVEKMASNLEELLERRARAAENIMRKTEEVFDNKTPPPSTYRFVPSQLLDELKKDEEPEPQVKKWTVPVNCTELRRREVEQGTHFGPDVAVNIDVSSVQTAADVFPCDRRVIGDIYWTDDLLSTFKENYEQDATIDFQYFCSAKGFLRHYPAATWSSMFQLQFDEEEVADVYDCRLRPWYVAASGAPRDILILLDSSGSMKNSSNQVVAETFILALLSALTDDDRVNVLWVNVEVKSFIQCFNDKLVPANYVNTAALMAAMKQNRTDCNITNIELALTVAVNLLNKERLSEDRPPACQQAIVLLADSMEENFTDTMRALDPEGRIRVFSYWLHDIYGLRDNSREYFDSISCASDGYYAELLASYDVTEQVMRLLRVLERPLVHQRKERLRAFSDIYAHVEDPRRTEYYWMKKEREEQQYRYEQLRRNKKALLSPKRRYKDWYHQESLEKLGQYYEGKDVDYRYLITVSVPVFESTLYENITIILNEEKLRKSTRTYPVNRLLGVAGVDISLDNLKTLFPFYQLGAGGSLFLVDHRGNIVLHENVKPTFDQDLLRQGYRTVDFLDVEQPGIELPPREYSLDWLEFRKALIIDHPRGNRTMLVKYIYNDGMRASVEQREYYWQRVMNHYTAVVVLPAKYNRKHAVPEGSFTQELAKKTYEVLYESSFSLHPDWLYCRHVDPEFEDIEFEVRHFINRRKDEPNFKMQYLKRPFKKVKLLSMFEKPYQCNEELMARLCKEIIATAEWADQRQDKDAGRDCDACDDLGAVTAFFASESGLMRWQPYDTSSELAKPPEGSLWPRGPDEPWFKRAVAAPNTLVIHAPVAPITKMRNTFKNPPPLGERYEWLTAARTLGYRDKDMIGVAGYHFYPEHLEKYLSSVTHIKCVEEPCPRCDGEAWSCVLIDEGGWVVAGHRPPRYAPGEDEPIRDHLARMYPQAMAALLTAEVFKLRWIHDYQAVCFPPADEKMPAAATKLPSILRSILHAAYAIIHITGKEILLVVLNSASFVAGETAYEKQLRLNKIMSDAAREKFDRLYDDSVLVNRTRIASCDRSRPFYEFQRYRQKELSRPLSYCSWPLVGAVVPRTNLILLAIANNCTYDTTKSRPLPDPFVNQLVDMTDGKWARTLSANRLACWRNRVPLPGRAPHISCYPHEYKQEEGYRQCTPWLPDAIQDEDDGASSVSLYKLLICVVLIVILPG